MFKLLKKLVGAFVEIVDASNEAINELEDPSAEEVIKTIFGIMDYLRKEVFHMDKGTNKIESSIKLLDWIKNNIHRHDIGACMAAVGGCITAVGGCLLFAGSRLMLTEKI